MASFTTALLSPPRLHTFGRGFRHVPSGGGARDRDVLALTEPPFDGPADAHDRLDRLESLFRAREDRRAVFLTVYTRVTGAVRAGIENGDFSDGAWVSDYLTAFADRYRAALHAFERGDRRNVPDAWQLAFATAVRDDALVVQHALLGINAHITNDLAFALGDAGVDPRRGEKHRDHDAVGGVLEDVVDDVQAVLAAEYAPGLATADAAFASLDELLAFRSVAEMRALAWLAAVARADARTQTGRASVAWVVSVLAAGAGQLVLAPTREPAVLADLRRAETAGAEDA